MKTNHDFFAYSNYFLYLCGIKWPIMDSKTVNNLKLVYVTPALYMAGGVERVLTLKANYFADHYGYVYVEENGKPSVKDSEGRTLSEKKLKELGYRPI